MQQHADEPRRPSLFKRASTARIVEAPLTWDSPSRRLEWEDLRAALDELTDVEALRNAFGFGGPKSLLQRPRSKVAEFLEVLLNLSSEADPSQLAAAKRLVLPKLRPLFEDRSGPLRRLQISWEDVLPALELAELSDLRGGLGSVHNLERFLKELSLSQGPAAVALAVAQSKPLLIKPMAAMKLVVAAPKESG